jgi:DNA-binding response OmpR family regulator
MKILIVEDEPALCESIDHFLAEEGYICEVAMDYGKAHQKIHVYKYDCILVDIGLPDGSGLTLIDELKKKRAEAGIIIISAKDSLDDRIAGLDLGADDYLTKPFHLSELNARIKAVERRKKFGGERQFSIGSLTVYPAKKEVFVNDELIELTSKEYDLLNYFITNKNRVLSKEAIAERVWGDHYDMVYSFDFIYVHIRNIRKKINQKADDDPIKTVYGMGYKFVAS